MEQKMKSIPIEVYEALKEEIEILSNKEMREAIEESEKAKNDGAPSITLVEESLSEIWENEDDERWNEC